MARTSTRSAGIRFVASIGPLVSALVIPFACMPNSGTVAPGGDASVSTGGAGAPSGTGGTSSTGGGGSAPGSGASGSGGTAIGRGGSGTGGAAIGNGGSGSGGPGGSGNGGSRGGGSVGSAGSGTGGSVSGGGGTGPGDAGTADAMGSVGAMPSLGCGMAATDTPAMFVRHTVDVAGTSREYFVRLPAMYNINRAYPVVFFWHGAGGTGTADSFRIAMASGTNAIVVGGTALVNATEMRTQWQFNSATSPDVAFFDAMVAEMSAHYCVDRARLFSAGFSSGAWFSNLLGCVRGNVMRAYGVVAGGLPGGARNNCTAGGVAAWFLHDLNDTENLISGNEMARARLLTANGCGTTTVPDTPAPCVRYEGCREGVPVVWCQTTGAGHSAQSGISGPGMWKFFSSF